MSNLKNVFKEVKPSVIIFLAVLALILSYFTLYSRITNILYLKLPNYQCGLEVLDDVNGQAIPNREVWIEQIILDGKTAMKQVMEFATENVGFEYRDASQYGYSCDVIVNTKGQDGRLSFEWKGGSEKVSDVTEATKLRPYLALIYFHFSNFLVTSHRHF